MKIMKITYEELLLLPLNEPFENKFQCKGQLATCGNRTHGFRGTCILLCALVYGSQLSVALHCTAVKNRTQSPNTYSEGPFSGQKF